MKFLILIIGLATVNFYAMAYKWANEHNLPNPGVTCVETSALKAHCDVSSKGVVYPLTCDAGRGGCFYNNRRM